MTITKTIKDHTDRWDDTQPKQANQEPEQTKQANQKRQSTKIKGTIYDKFIHFAALAVVLALVLGIWWVGAYCTVQWVRSLDAINDTAYIWIIPIAITIAEIGLQRARNGWIIGIWLVILAIDVATTAAGVHTFAHDQHGIAMPFLEYISLSIGIGFVVALAPERIARSIITELRRG